MKTVYVPVDVKEFEDLPKEDGEYFMLTQAESNYRNTFFRLIAKDEFWNIIKWLKPIQLPDEKEIEKAADEDSFVNNMGQLNTIDSDTFKRGCNHILKLLGK